MVVYVVLMDGAYGAQIEKIFTSKSKAEAYQMELQKKHPYYYYYVEEHQAI